MNPRAWMFFSSTKYMLSIVNPSHLVMNRFTRKIKVLGGVRFPRASI